MVNIMIDKNTFVKTLDGLKYVMDFNADLNHFSGREIATRR